MCNSPLWAPNKIVSLNFSNDQGKKIGTIFLCEFYLVDSYEGFYEILDQRGIPEVLGWLIVQVCIKILILSKWSDKGRGMGALIDLDPCNDPSETYIIIPNIVIWTCVILFKFDIRSMLYWEENGVPGFYKVPAPLVDSPWRSWLWCGVRAKGWWLIFFCA